MTTLNLNENAQLAYDTIMGKETHGINSWGLNVMEHRMLEKFSGNEPGSYKERPVEVYLAFQKAIGTCMIDQWIPRNPLSMEAQGYEDKAQDATTGAEDIVVDGMKIDSPEQVAAHMEKYIFPQLEADIAVFDENARVAEILKNEADTQELFGGDILKTGYSFIGFPTLAYYTYGYVNYFMAYALYPELIAKHFKLQADLKVLQNTAAAQAYTEGDLPPLYRLDHDMADSRGTLVDIKSLDKIWFPEFARCMEPVLETDVNLIWHCDGNLMEMVPRLLECGLKGFQGFQYEDGMDYKKICAMKDKDGESLHILAGVSVTTTLPQGTPEDVKKELAFLVEHGPKTKLTLTASSSVAPGVSEDNLRTLIEGMAYYRKNGRS